MTRSDSNKPVRTPLHLLHDLTDSLVTYLEKTCAQAQQEAEKALTKLEKQRGKIQEKLLKAQHKLDKATQLEKKKAVAKAKKAIGEYRELYDQLQDQQKNLLSYISTLKKNSDQTLNLTKGIYKIKEKVAGLLNEPLIEAKEQPSKPTQSIARKPSAKVASSSAVKSTKPRATRAATKPLNKNVRASSVAKATPRQSLKTQKQESSMAEQTDVKPTPTRKTVTRRKTSVISTAPKQDKS